MRCVSVQLRPDARIDPVLRCTPLQTHSHLYKTDGSMVGTFQRIDIPILKEFDQYNYVLFTGGCIPLRFEPCCVVILDCGLIPCSEPSAPWARPPHTAHLQTATSTSAFR